VIKPCTDPTVLHKPGHHCSGRCQGKQEALTLNKVFLSLLSIAVSVVQTGGQCLLIALFFVSLSKTAALALESVEQGGIIFVYEKENEDIISRMAAQTPSMLSFLDEMGLPIERRIHVVLDDALDLPEVIVHMIPHSEVRIPLKAPGVLEEGYTMKDPWSYFFFKGLCLHGIYSMRSKIPGIAHKAFGEIVSPNLIMPQWLTEGTCALLYELYTGAPLDDPMNRALFSTHIPQDIARVSNHPGTWPGHYSYRIYGRPFISWLYERYGWNGIHDFLHVHGGGIIPIEIDLKARKTFGKTWTDLWSEFGSQRMTPGPAEEPGLLILGYIPDPLIYWNVSGINPGAKRVRLRSRYGLLDGSGNLWVSEYDPKGVSRIAVYGRSFSSDQPVPHIWDPGAGGVAVTRKGNRPYLALLEMNYSSVGAGFSVKETIPAPEGILQLSGPVMNSRGRIAAAANTGGNWDIWVYDTAWHRVTSSESVEMDPSWEGDALVFSSSITGSFQLHLSDMSQLTYCRHAGVLPKNGSFLCLEDQGWKVQRHAAQEITPVPVDPQSNEGTPVESLTFESDPYSPWKSIPPNFIAPDLYAGVSDVQLGVNTWGRDVTGEYSADAGIRYSFKLDYVSARMQAQMKGLGAGFTRYPISYDPENTSGVEESRNELRLFFRPKEYRFIEISLHRLGYEPLKDFGDEDVEFWGSLSLNKRFSFASAAVTAESYSRGRKSLFATIRFMFGSDIYSTFYLQAGKTWKGCRPGHGSFRIGGDTGEGYFTRRPTRLFAVRGFSSNVLEADKALATGIELYLPLANIQKGYKTLPLFFHRLYLGTFVDAGVCSETISFNDRVMGAGVELVTSMEIAWGNLSSFRMGVAWPVKQPHYLDENGPLFIIQVGRPL